LICPYNVETCKCADCTKNAAFDGCTSGYCIECFECEDAGQAVHNVFMCTGYKSRSEEVDQE